MAFPMEVLTVAAMVALAGAAIRRYLFTPPRLERSRDATIILLLITLLLVTFLWARGPRRRRRTARHRGARWADLIGGRLGGLSASAAPSTCSWRCGGPTW